MNKTIVLFSLLILSSCASSYLSESDKKKIALGDKYPDCWHQYRVVFDKCAELNEAGQKVDAMRTEQLMKDGKTLN